MLSRRQMMRKNSLGTTIVSVCVLLLVAGILIAPLFHPNMSMYVIIVALGFALALQKYVASFAGFFVLRISKLFAVGDRIRMGQLNIKGDVRRIGLLHFVLDEVGEGDKSGGELTGRVLHIPNHVVLDQPVLNFSQDFTADGKFIACEYVFDEVRIPLPQGMSLPAARRSLEQILSQEDHIFIEKAKNSFGKDSPNFLHEANQSPRVMVFVDGAYTWLVGRFVAPVRLRNGLRSAITVKFLEGAGAEMNHSMPLSQTPEPASGAEPKKLETPVERGERP
jgi:small-conductance mechanosensitive channel